MLYRIRGSGPGPGPRARGAGFASAFGRIGATRGPTIRPVLVRDHGPAAAIRVGAGGFLIAALLVLTLGVESCAATGSTRTSPTW